MEAEKLLKKRDPDNREEGKTPGVIAPLEGITIPPGVPFPCWKYIFCKVTYNKQKMSNDEKILKLARFTQIERKNFMSFYERNSVLFKKRNEENIKWIFNDFRNLKKKAYFEQEDNSDSSLAAVETDLRFVKFFSEKPLKKTEKKSSQEELQTLIELANLIFEPTNKHILGEIIDRLPELRSKLIDYISDQEETSEENKQKETLKGNKIKENQRNFQKIVYALDKTQEPIIGTLNEFSKKLNELEKQERKEKKIKILLKQIDELPNDENYHEAKSQKIRELEQCELIQHLLKYYKNWRNWIWPLRIIDEGLKKFETTLKDLMVENLQEKQKELFRKIQICCFLIKIVPRAYALRRARKEILVRSEKVLSDAIEDLCEDGVIDELEGRAEEAKLVDQEAEKCRSEILDSELNDEDLAAFEDYFYQEEISSSFEEFRNICESRHPQLTKDLKLKYDKDLSCFKANLKNREENPKSLNIRDLEVETEKFELMVKFLTEFSQEIKRFV